MYDFVKLTELYYVGSHGMDIMGPAKSSNGSKEKLYQDNREASVARNGDCEMVV